MINLKESVSLAEGLRNSNVEEVKKLAEAFLGLKIAYDELEHNYIKRVSQDIMRKHYNLLKRLDD